MPLGNLQDEGDLQRWLQDQLDSAGLTSAFVNRSNTGLLKLVTPGDVHISRGSSVINWPGVAATGSLNTVVAHGLSVIPAQVLGFPRGMPFAGGVTVTFKCPARDATNITLNGEASAAVTGAVPLDWVAIG